MTYLYWPMIFASLLFFWILECLAVYFVFFFTFWVYLLYFRLFSWLFCFLVMRRNLTLGKVVFWLRNWTFFTELRGVNFFWILIFFSVRTEKVLFITKYNKQLSRCIYQTRIVRETKKVTLTLLKREMEHKKKYGLIADPRDVIKNNDRARTFP